MIRDAGNEQPPKNAPFLPIRGRGTPQISRWFLVLQPLPHWDACNDEINRSRLVIRHLSYILNFPHYMAAAIMPAAIKKPLHITITTAWTNLKLEGKTCLYQTFASGINHRCHHVSGECV